MDKMLKLLQNLFPEGKAKTTGPNTWVFNKGSATIRVKIIKGAESVWFSVESEIMRVPNQNLMRFYKKVLELNGPATFGAFFSVRNDILMVSSLRTVEGLEPKEIESIVTIVAEVADKYDDELKLMFKN